MAADYTLQDVLAEKKNAHCGAFKAVRSASVVEACAHDLIAFISLHAICFCAAAIHHVLLFARESRG